MNESEIRARHAKEVNVGAEQRGAPDAIRNAAVAMAYDRIEIKPTKGPYPEVRLRLSSGARLPATDRAIGAFIDDLLQQAELAALGPAPDHLAATRLANEAGCTVDEAMAVVQGKARRELDGSITVRLPGKPSDGYSPAGSPVDLTGPRALDVLVSWGRAQLKAPRAAPRSAPAPTPPPAPTDAEEAAARAALYRGSI